MKKRKSGNGNLNLIRAVEKHFNGLAEFLWSHKKFHGLAAYFYGLTKTFQGLLAQFNGLTKHFHDLAAYFHQK